LNFSHVWLETPIQPPPQKKIGIWEIDPLN